MVVICVAINQLDRCESIIYLFIIFNLPQRRLTSSQRLSKEEPEWFYTHLSHSCTWRVANKAGINRHPEKQIDATRAHWELSDNNTQDAEEGPQPSPLHKEWMLVPSLVWDLKRKTPPILVKLNFPAGTSVS